MLISVGLHALLLAVAAFFMQFTTGTVAAVEPEPSVLRFSFAPEEDGAEEASRPEGAVPFETPQPQPESQPPSEAQAEPDFQPSELPSLQPPSSPEPPGPETNPAEQVQPAEEIDEPAELEEMLEEPAEAEVQPDQPGTELYQDPEATLREGPSPEQPLDRESRGRALDLGRALQDFERAVERARAAAPPTPSGGGSARNVFMPDPANLPPTGYGVGNLTFESQDFDWSEYARSIYWEIWKAWHRRLYYSTEEFERWGHANRRFDLNHQAGIRFVIEASGDVTGIVIEGTSGCPPLDASAADALAEVTLPPLPADFPRDQEVVHARFIAIGHIMEMRRTLQWLRGNGYF